MRVISLVGDQEDLFPGASEAQLFACDLLDGAGLRPERLDLDRKAAVLVVEVIYLTGERFGTVALLDDVQIAAVAEEPVQEQGENGNDARQYRGLLAETSFSAL